MESAGADRDPKDRSEKSVRIPFSRSCFVVLTAAAVVVISVSALLLHHEYQEQLAHWQDRLTRIANLNQRLVEAWLRERQNDAEAASSLPGAKAVLAAGPRKSGERNAAELHLQTEIDSLSAVFGYAGVYVVDTNGRVRVASTGAAPIPPEVVKASREPRRRTVTLLNFDAKTYPQLAFLVPITRGSSATGSPKGMTVGTLAAVTKKETLSSLLLSDNGATETGETVFLEADRGRAVVVSPLRSWRPTHPGTLPTLGSSSPGYIAAIERRQVFGSFKDYRGVPVLAVTKFIPGVEWGMVSKVDRKEALNSFQETLWRSVLIASARIFVLFFIVLGLWRHRQVHGLMQEVEQRKRTEEVLRRSEARLRAALKLPVHTWIHTLPAEQGQLLSTTDTEIIDEDAAADIIALKWQVIETGRGVRREIRITASGQTYYYDLTAEPLFGADGSIRGISCAAIETTDRKRVDKALHASEQQYRLLFDRNVAGMFRVTLTGQLLECNESVARMFGYSREELLRIPVTRLYQEPKERAAEVAELCAQGFLRDHEFRGRHKDGHTVWALANSGFVAAVEGKSEVIEVTLVDITERKRAEGALRKTADRLSLMIEAANLGSWDWDLVGDDLTWSPRCRELFGLPPGIPMNHELFLARLHPEDRDRIDRAERTAVEQHTLYDVELRTVWSDSSVHWIISRGRAYYDDSGRPVRMSGVAMDITEKRELEEQLRQSQKMEAVGRLAGGIAHDFNNLLTAINMNSALMLRDLPADSALHLKARQILDATERGTTLTRGLLAFSRKQVLAPRIVDLNALIDDMIPLVRGCIPEDIFLVIRRGENLGKVKADPRCIEQVILNLVTNARDALSGRGTMTIESSNVNIGTDRNLTPMAPGLMAPGRYVMLAVSDTGSGMDLEIQARAFEPFFTTKPPGKGTGLGLATSYGIVKQSGGYVFLYSEKSVGTTLKVYLPCVEVQPATPYCVDVECRSRAKLDGHSASNRTPSIGGGETILLVEDEISVRNATAECLRSQGYTVLEVADGAEALQIAMSISTAIDAVITDVIMPGLTGPQVVEVLAQLRPSLKVLYISGYTQDAMVEHSLRPGTNFLQKPFTVETLSALLRQVLDSPQREPISSCND